MTKIAVSTTGNDFLIRAFIDLSERGDERYWAGLHLLPYLVNYDLYIEHRRGKGPTE